AALDIGEEPVVGVLERRVGRVEDVLVPEARQDRGDRRLADLAALPPAVRGGQGVERPDPADPRDLIKLLTAGREVLAEAVVHPGAGGLELLLDDVADARQAAAAAGAGQGAALDLAHGREFLPADRLAEPALADAHARADLGVDLARIPVTRPG